MRAAVANGADAVYFGLQQFNARHRANNFQIDELPTIMKYLHDRGVKGYVTFNILIFTDEVTFAMEQLRKINAAGVDAVIVQDLGITRLIQQLLPTLPIHGSTQMTLTEPRGVEMVKQLGVSRVILARELTAVEVNKIASTASLPVEVFVHGALCVSYSGQCLTSEALGGRSANRGQCAQACRLPYQLLVDGVLKDLGDKAYLISPQDLAAYDQVAELIAGGVVSFKIEGRLKKPEYVAATVQTYRRAVDAAIAQQPFKITTTERLGLEQIFSRGLSAGFLKEINHQTLVPARSPKKRGVRIGTLLGKSNRGFIIQLSRSDVPTEALVKPGDGIVFDAGRPEEKELGARVTTIYARKPQQVEVILYKPVEDFPDFPADVIVWKTDDPALNKKLQKTFDIERPLATQKIDAVLAGAVGGELRLTLRLSETLEATASWPGPLEAARKFPATVDSVREQLSRLTEAGFDLGAVELQCDHPVMIPKSVLNELRRQAVTGLQEVIAKVPAPVYPEWPTVKEKLGLLRTQWRKEPATLETQQPQLHILCRSMEQLQTVAAWRRVDGTAISSIWMELEDIRRYKEAVEIARQANISIGLATLRVLKASEEGWLRMIASFQPDRLLVRNLGALQYYQQNYPDMQLIGDFSLNVVNDATAHWLLSQSLQRLVPGFDLSWEQFQSLMHASRPEYFEPVIHYHMPMFHNEHCVYAALLSDGKDWKSCGRPCDHHKITLRDRTEADFPVIPDAGCRNTVFNSLPQSAAEYLPQMLQLGVRHFRIELLRETSEQINTLLNQYDGILQGKSDAKTVWKQLKAVHQLGVTRGTLQMV